MRPVLILAGYVVLLVVTASWLRRAAWVDRAPLLAVAAWYALSAGLVLTAVLGGIVLMVPRLPWTPDLAMLFQACALELRAQYATPAGGAVSALGLGLVVAVVARLVHRVGAAFLAAAGNRRRQEDLLRLVARRDPALDALVIDHPVAAAYCLSGRRRLVVLTSAAVAALDSEQLGAVLAHERAHLRGRHHLILASVSGLRRAFPFLPLLRHAQEEITRLIEIVADDAASRRYPRRTVARALVALAEAGSPQPALAAGGPSTLARVRRLLAPPRPVGAARTAAGSLAVTMLVLLPMVIAVVPAIVAIVTSTCPYAWAGHPTPPPP